MSKLFFCSNCGLRLNPYRKALPKIGRIVNLIQPHECSEEPHEFDIEPLDVPTFVPSEDDNKFVKKLTELSPPPTLYAESMFATRDIDLRDRRPVDQVKSSAPESLKSYMKNMVPTTPAHDISNEPKPE